LDAADELRRHGLGIGGRARTEPAAAASNIRTNAAEFAALAGGHSSAALAPGQWVTGHGRHRDCRRRLGRGRGAGAAQCVRAEAAKCRARQASRVTRRALAGRAGNLGTGHRWRRRGPRGRNSAALYALHPARRILVGLRLSRLGRRPARARFGGGRRAGGAAVRLSRRRRDLTGGRRRSSFHDRGDRRSNHRHHHRWQCGPAPLAQQTAEGPMNTIQGTAFFAGSVRLALPVLFAATGELVSERAGVLNLSLEGMMLTGAFSASITTAATGSAVLGVCAAMLTALLFAAGQAFLTVKAGANQLVVGIAANALALGFTSFAARRLLLDGAGDKLSGFDAIRVPVLGQLPVVGEALFGQSSLAYVGLVLVALTLLMLDRTGWGLAITAVGEDAHAADRAGTPVRLVRTLAILWTGVMAGFGGAFIALADVHAFTQNMTAGRGYLAIVAVIAG